MKKHIITVTAIKGGVGKSTTAGALAECAAADGKRALLVDLDPQRNLTFVYQTMNTPNTIYNVFAGAELTAAIQPASADGLDLIPGSGNLTALKTTRNSARRLEAALDPIAKDYDFVIIDTAPGMGELLNNAIFAANEVLIPLEADILSIQGLYTLTDIMTRAQEAKPNLAYCGALITQYDKRPTLNRELRDVIRDYTAKNGIPYLGEVRRCVKVREAWTLAKPLYSYAPTCNAAIDYLDIYKHITEGE